MYTYEFVSLNRTSDPVAFHFVTNMIIYCFLNVQS